MRDIQRIVTMDEFIRIVGWPQPDCYHDCNRSHSGVHKKSRRQAYARSEPTSQRITMSNGSHLEETPCGQLPLNVDQSRHISLVRPLNSQELCQQVRFLQGTSRLWGPSARIVVRLPHLQTAC